MIQHFRFYKFIISVRYCLDRYPFCLWNNRSLCGLPLSLKNSLLKILTQIIGYAICITAISSHSAEVIAESTGIIRLLLLKQSLVVAELHYF